MPLAAPTIAVFDNANGTGCYAMLTGSTAGAVHTAEVLQADKPTSEWAATTYSRTGPGSIDIGLASEDGVTKGVNLTHAWKVRVRSTDSPDEVLSDIRVVCPSSGLATPHFKAMAAAQKKIIEADISGLNGRVYRGEHPEMLMNQVEQMPCVFIYPADAEQRQGASNLTSLWTYPVLVGIADREGTLFKESERHLFWRQSVMDVFDRKALRTIASVSLARRVTIQPRQVFNVISGGEDGQRYQFTYSYFALMVEVDRAI